MYDKYSDGDRDQINRIADYSFSSFNEIIKQFELEKGDER